MLTMRKPSGLTPTHVEAGLCFGAHEAEDDTMKYRTPT